MKKIILFLCICFFSLDTNAQLLRTMGISLNSETVAFPFTRYAPIHPGVEFFATIKEKDNSRWRQQFNAQLGFFYHKKIETGIYAGAEYMPTLKLFNTIGIQAPMGIGYLHSFFPGDVYEQDAATGEFENQRQFGRPHFYLQVGIGLTYIKSARIQPFIQQGLMIETPFANGIPFIPHSLLKIGFQVSF